ncbi:MAG: SagB/ThcOx family dehydrogenase [Chloroflexi bacterium]|nr:SagB/ThcOx family dehydrogenase [Chloroflexota bacterium]MCL5075075.1 SagB/ThcOx family dehydrogenase [Chloroflexota bacterium]
METIQLPTPRLSGQMSLEEAVMRRRSVRRYSRRELSLEEISQLLWVAQGITDRREGLRAAPSAGALYPVELYAVLSQGIYHYSPRDHSLKMVKPGDWREQLSAAALGQRYIWEAPLNMIITVIYERTAAKYGARAERYVILEAGHIAQNVHLQAVALALASVPIAAFYDQKVQLAIGCPPNHQPLYIIPVGVPR